MGRDALQQAATILAECERAVALTGAGISVESGIPDFRSPGGLWERFDPMVYARIDTFLQQPGRSWEMFLAVEEILEAAQPNAAHFALADLERQGVLRSVITQNIDGLHQAAGSRTVREFHGSHAELHCVACEARYPRERALDGIPPRCVCGRALKPAVVLFGEAIPQGVAASSARDAELCDAMLVIGTSAEVYPAAALPHQVHRRGVPVIVVDLEPTSLCRDIPCVFVRGTASEVLDTLVSEVRRLRAGSGERHANSGNGPGGRPAASVDTLG